MTGIPPAVYRHYLYGTNTMKPYKIVAWGGGGGGYSTNIYTGRLRPESNPVTPLYTIFPEKRTPFVYLLLTNGTLLHTLFKTLHPFNCCKCDVFHNRNQSQK